MMIEKAIGDFLRWLDRLSSHLETRRDKMPEENYEEAVRLLNWMKANPEQIDSSTFTKLLETISNKLSLTPNLQEYTQDGYPITYREAGKRLLACEATRESAGRLLFFASWIQVHGWQALDPNELDYFRASYQQAGVDVMAIDFTR